MRRTLWPYFATALVAATCGCSLVQPANLPNVSAQRQSASEIGVVNRVDSSPFFLNDIVRELDFDQLKPGQHVQLLTDTETNRSPGHVATAERHQVGHPVKPGKRERKRSAR